MTEREAWAALAEQAATRSMPSGICREITCLVDRGQISKSVADRMRRRVYAYGEKRQLYYYLWPRNDGGYDARARFCKRQVSRLTRKKVKVKKQR
jgi:hypothetical protein